LGWEVNTSQNAVLFRGLEAKAGIAYSTCGFNMWVAGKTLYPLLTRAIPERLRDEQLI